jgi:Flp pilus assembly protein TadG
MGQDYANGHSQRSHFTVRSAIDSDQAAKPMEKRRMPNQSDQQPLHHRLQVEQNGATLVEFALSLTLLLMLTFGMIDLCRAVYTVTVVQAAAQVGARTGVINLNQATPTVQSRLFGLNPAQAQVTAALVNNEQVTVEVTYQFEFITPYLSQLVTGGVVQLSGKASMAVQ